MQGHISVTDRHGVTKKLVLDLWQLFSLGEALQGLADKQAALAASPIGPPENLIARWSRYAVEFRELGQFITTPEPIEEESSMG